MADGIGGCVGWKGNQEAAFKELEGEVVMAFHVRLSWLRIGIFPLRLYKGLCMRDPPFSRFQ